MHLSHYSAPAASASPWPPCSAARGQNVSLLARGSTRDAILADGVHKTGLFGDLDFAADDFTVSDDHAYLSRRQL